MKEALQKGANVINDGAALYTKAVLTSDEAARYMGISKAYLYKLTMMRKIPYYKPMGKICYFNRAELEQWLQNNRIATDSEISEKAREYCSHNR